MAFSNTYTTNLVKSNDSPDADEYQGCTTLTFVKPDGSGELGQQCTFRPSRTPSLPSRLLTSYSTLVSTTAHMDWLQDVPWGLRKLLNYLYDRYKKPIYMTENVSPPPRHLHPYLPSSTLR